MTTIVTQQKTYSILETYDDVTNKIREWEQVSLGDGWLYVNIRPIGRTVGQVPVQVRISDVKAVEYE